MMAKLAIAMMVLAVGSPALADGFEATGRLGVTKSVLNDENADSPLDGTGPELGLELGLALAGIHPAIVVDFGQFTGHGNDLTFHGAYTTRERVGNLALQLRVDAVAMIDFTVRVGGTLDMEHIDGFDRHTFGWHYAIGVGAKVWQDRRQAVRLDLTYGSSHFTPDGDDLTLVQISGSVGYTVKF